MHNLLRAIALVLVMAAAAPLCAQVLTVDRLAVAAQPVLTTETGPGGNGFQAGTFTVTNNAGGPAGMTAISIMGSGTGNDSTTYTQVALYEDINLNSVFDFGVDTLFAPAAVAFPTDNGVLPFAAPAAVNFAVSQMRRYFVVVKLNSAVPALNGETFYYSVLSVTAVAGTNIAGAPTPVMLGLVITGPTLTVAAMAVAAQQVAQTATGPGGSGIHAATFTLTANALGPASLNSITIAGSGSGNDATAYTQVALYEDSNQNAVFDFGVDPLFAPAVAAFPANDGSVQFVPVAPVNFAASQMRRYLIVVKLNSPALALNGQTFNFSAIALGVGAGAGQAGVPSAVMTGLVVIGPVLTVTVTPGVPQAVSPTATGPGGNGILAATFMVSNSAAAGASLNAISIAASGTGNDSNAYSMVELHEDSNANTTYEFGTDVPIGASFVAFPADNGILTFVSPLPFAVSQARRFFMVVKMAGTVPALTNQTFSYSVPALTVGAGTSTSGVPSAVMNGLVIQGAPSVFTFVDVSAGGPVQANVNTSGNVCQSFVISYQAGTSDKPSSVSVTGLGTADEAADLVSAQLWYDADGNGVYGAVLDTLVDTQQFAADNGTVVFSMASHPNFASGNTRRFFVVYQLNGNASLLETFRCYVSAAGPATLGAVNNGIPAPAFGSTPGLVVNAPHFIIADVSAPAAAQAFIGSVGNVCQSFTVTNAFGPADKPSSVTITGLGTGNEAADLSAVELWHDADNNGAFNAALDTQVDAGAFSANNGTATFSMASHPAFPVGAPQRFFMVYDLNGNAAAQATFRCFVSAAGASAAGATVLGLPVPSVAGTSGLIAAASELNVQFNGPALPAIVSSNDTGPGGDGVLLCDITLTTVPPATWIFQTLTFEVTGSLDSASAFSQVRLFEDTGSGHWNGSSADPPASSLVPAFTGGAATFTIFNGSLVAGTPRRLFLAGKLNATALAGQDFGARLASLTTVAQPGTRQLGVPTAFSTAFVIGTPALVVTAGPNPPVLTTHKAGNPRSLVVGRVRFTAVNSAAAISALALTGGGTGDWTSDIDSVNGVRVYRDDGDGVFTATDVQISQAGGAATMNAVLAAPVNIANGAFADLWLQISVTANAGMGAAAAPETFLLSLASGAAVSASAGVTVVLGAPAPSMTPLGAIEFVVDIFNPLGADPAGGQAITISGSGFVAPLVVRIGGVVCPGTPAITGGTQVAGLIVPPGAGENLSIEIQSGALSPQTLAQKFSYTSSESDPGGKEEPKGCAAMHGPGAVPLVALALLAWRMRVRRRV